MVEITPEMVEAGARAVAKVSPYRDYDASSADIREVFLRQSRAALEAVAPLIEAQARGEMEKVIGAARVAHDLISADNTRLRAELAQARAAAIEEAAKVVEAFKVNLDDDRSAQKQLAEHIRALNDKTAATPKDGG